MHSAAPSSGFLPDPQGFPPVQAVSEQTFRLLPNLTLLPILAASGFFPLNGSVATAEAEPVSLTSLVPSGYCPHCPSATVTSACRSCLLSETLAHLSRGSSGFFRADRVPSLATEP